MDYHLVGSVNLTKTLASSKFAYLNCEISIVLNFLCSYYLRTTTWDDPRTKQRDLQAALKRSPNLSIEHNLHMQVCSLLS